ncbi:MAG TPA: hypothetical protein VJ901_14305 [Thermoanaerobaculia bacterium]|nr:hypothetical protein [Thermoanaerobaculia bacterium]
MSTTAIIQIVGIFLLSYQIVPGQLVAVAPRIPCPPQAVQTKSGRIAVSVPASAAEQEMLSQGIAPHGALLLMQPCDFISSNGWTPTPSILESNGQLYLYVRLDGEQIRFNTGIRPATTSHNEAAISEPSRRIADVDKLMGLPHVYGEQCCTQPKLRDEYTPAGKYKLAAAVVDFSNASPTVCNTSGRRQDTVINVTNNGKLTIEATKNGTTKSITVKGNAELIFANVPLDAVPGTASCGAGGGNSHNAAYLAMVVPCAQYKPCATSSPSNSVCAKQPVLIMSLPNTGSTDPSARSTAECSNNQWP